MTVRKKELVLRDVKGASLKTGACRSLGTLTECAQGERIIKNNNNNKMVSKNVGKEDII